MVSIAADVRGKHAGVEEAFMSRKMCGGQERQSL